MCGMEHELSEGLCLPCKWAEAHESTLLLSPDTNQTPHPASFL